jgi:hypothetical protein
VQCLYSCRMTTCWLLITNDKYNKNKKKHLALLLLIHTYAASMLGNFVFSRRVVASNYYSFITDHHGCISAFPSYLLFIMHDLASSTVLPRQ